MKRLLQRRSDASAHPIASIVLSFCHFLSSILAVATASLAYSDEAISPVRPNEISLFVENHCLQCHDGSSSLGGLDLEKQSFDLDDPQSFARWEKIHDRVRAGEMPPPDEVEVEPSARRAWLDQLSTHLINADLRRIATRGRSAIRRLNREEYENTLREVLEAPWLQVAEKLPVDGVDHLFNKSDSALPFSFVHYSRYLETAEYALRQALQSAAYAPLTTKYYAREEPSIYRRYLHYATATRSVMPLDGVTAEPDVIRGTQPLTVGAADSDKREREAFGVFCGIHGSATTYDFRRMAVATAGSYRIRIKSYSFLAGANGADGLGVPRNEHGLSGGDRAWWRPDRNVAMRAKRSEPVTLYALSSNGSSRWLTTFDALPDPTVFECVVALDEGDCLRPDAARLVRTRPGWKGNPNATQEGVPGWAVNWLEVEGPLHDDWPPRSYQALFADMPFAVDEANRVQEPERHREADRGGTGRRDRNEVAPRRVCVVSTSPDEDAQRLLRRFQQRVHPGVQVSEEAVESSMTVYQKARSLGYDFTDAMISAMATILSAPQTLYLESRPGALSGNALASRLGYFLWNSPPDKRLQAALEACGPDALEDEANRMLDDVRSERFVNALLDYWLDLRDLNVTAPDAELYPEYFLDELLTESSLLETRRFFRELIDANLPVRNLVDADFAFVNERLAVHYRLPVFEGVGLVKRELPKDSPRGGLLTQASVLKVTSNGTTTSPVLRGVWVMKRLLGVDIPPPPSGVAAIEPDIRGATTIREQLELHRAEPSCNACHKKFDAVGFSLESFDVAGGWREMYRAVGDTGNPIAGVGKNGNPYRFSLAKRVECDGQLEDGREFDDVRKLKRLLASDERVLARSFLNRLVAFATGAPPSFAERAEVERMLDRASAEEYGIRTLILEVVRSEMFRTR